MSTSATPLDACALCCYKVNQTTSISTNVSKTCCVTSQKSAMKTFENLSKVPLKIHMSLNVAATFPWAISLCNLLLCSKKWERIHMRPNLATLFYMQQNDSKNCNSAPCGLPVSPLLSRINEFTLKTIWRYHVSKNIVRALACAFCLQNLLVYLKQC